MDNLDLLVVNNIPDEKGCLNKNVYSSMLFIFPIIYAYILLPYSDVMFGSIACLITSVIHHYYKAQNKILRVIDILTVNITAVYFTTDCIRKIGMKFYAIIMYFFAASALGFYLYTLYKPDLYCDYHYLVHVLSITGIMFYIKARKTYYDFSPAQTLLPPALPHSSLSSSPSLIFPLPSLRPPPLQLLPLIN